MCYIFHNTYLFKTVSDLMNKINNYLIFHNVYYELM